MCLAFQSFPAPLCRVVTASADALVIDESLIIFSPGMSISAMGISGHGALWNTLCLTFNSHAVGIAAATVAHTSIGTRVVGIVGMAFRTVRNPCGLAAPIFLTRNSFKVKVIDAD